MCDGGSHSPTPFLILNMHLTGRIASLASERGGAVRGRCGGSSVFCQNTVPHAFSRYRPVRCSRNRGQL